MKNSFIFLLTSVFLIMVIEGCALPPSPLIEFQAQEDIRMTFSYPADWEWTSPSYNFWMADIYPDSSKTDIWIYITVDLSKSPQSAMTDRINLSLSRTALPQYKILNQKMQKIDGYDAKWYVIQVTGTNRVIPDEPYIAETIFILCADRFYEIGLQYTESENPRFYKEFQALIDSINILP